MDSNQLCSPHRDQIYSLTQHRQTPARPESGAIVRENCGPSKSCKSLTINNAIQASPRCPTKSTRLMASPSQRQSTPSINSCQNGQSYSSVISLTDIGGSLILTTNQSHSPVYFHSNHFPTSH